MTAASFSTKPIAAPDTRSESAPLIFGIFPGMAGTEDLATGAAALSYDPDRTEEALARLHQPGRPFVIRQYVIYRGEGRIENQTPPEVTPYLGDRRILDHVVCYRSQHGDIGDWTSFLRRTVRQLGDGPAALQVAEEPNNPDAAAGGDGSSPNVHQAVVEGVLAAKDEASRLGLPIQVGFNACPSFNPTDGFWPEIAALGGPSFVRSLDYVGFDFFPDVFRPIPPERLKAAIEGVLTHFRTVNLASAGIPESVPIRITENGWPTGAGRSPERQAEVLETIVRIVHSLHGSLNITHYEFFCLRDPGGEGPGFREFGLLRDDYTPKPAFDTYWRLIKELGSEKTYRV